jgi:hypothetical protein
LVAGAPPGLSTVIVNVTGAPGGNGPPTVSLVIDSDGIGAENTRFWAR